jgi:hypothetical protein
LQGDAPLYYKPLNDVRVAILQSLAQFLFVHPN